MAFVPARAAVQPATNPDMFLGETEGLDNPPGWTLRTGFLATDNIQRRAEDGDDELVGVAEFGANWSTAGSRFAGAFDGTVAYRHYTQNDFDDEARANFLAAGSWFMIPRTLDWFAMDRIANAPIDPLATTSPSNIQFVNVFETGPRLTLRPGDSNELTVTVSRADVRAEESEIDHLRDTATVGFTHDLNANDRAGLVVTGRSIDFDETAQGDDFDAGQAYFSYERPRDTWNLSAAAGMAKVELENGLEGDTGVGWLRIGARRTSDSYVYFNFEREASDTAATLVRDDVLMNTGGAASLFITGDPYFADRAVLRYTRGWREHQWFLSAFGRKLDYFVSELDQQQRGGQAGMRFVFTSRFALDLSATSYDIEYEDSGRDDSIRVLLAEGNYLIDRRWSLLSGVRYMKRDSTNENYRFDELMLTLFLSFSPTGRNPSGGDL